MDDDKDYGLDRVQTNRPKRKKERQKRQNGYNSTWHDKHSLGLGTQTWHGAHKHKEDSIKHVESIDPST